MDTRHHYTNKKYRQTTNRQIRENEIKRLKRSYRRNKNTLSGLRSSGSHDRSRTEVINKTMSSRQ